MLQFAFKPSGDYLNHSLKNWRSLSKHWKMWLSWRYFSYTFCFAIWWGLQLPPNRFLVSPVRCKQARYQLETLGGAKSFLRGAQIFQTMSNGFKLRPTYFSRWGEKFCWWRRNPPVTGLV